MSLTILLLFPIVVIDLLLCSPVLNFKFCIMFNFYLATDEGWAFYVKLAEDIIINHNCDSVELSSLKHIYTHWITLFHFSFSKRRGRTISITTGRKPRFSSRRAQIRPCVGQWKEKRRVGRLKSYFYANQQKKMPRICKKR